MINQGKLRKCQADSIWWSCLRVSGAFLSENIFLGIVLSSQQKVTFKPWWLFTINEQKDGASFIKLWVLDEESKEGLFIKSYKSQHL